MTGAFLALGLPVDAQAAASELPRCPLVPSRAPVRLVSGPPPANALARLEVLRRPAAPSDRAFALRDVEAATINRDFVRLLGTGPRGERYFLVPATPSPVRFSARCKRRLPAARRRQLERVERDERAAARRPVLILHEVDRDGGGSTSEVTLDEIYENAFSIGCRNRQCQAGRATLHAPVPDGVAAVRLRFPGGLDRTVPVVSNFWVIEVPLDFDDAEPASVAWLGPDGQIVREFDEDGF